LTDSEVSAEASSTQRGSDKVPSLRLDLLDGCKKRQRMHVVLLGKVFAKRELAFSQEFIPVLASGIDADLDAHLRVKSDSLRSVY
jgi:hypothetical protein